MKGYAICNGKHDSEEGWVYLTYGPGETPEMLIVGNEFTDGFGAHFEMEKDCFIEITKEEYDKIVELADVDCKTDEYYAYEKLLLAKGGE